MLRFSVIVPVYNVEAYLSECVESLLKQDTAEPYEILLVDDGSTDTSGALCDGFAARDSRVRVLHQKNGGVSAARNAGMAAAQGTYLLFADPDDLWVPGLLSTLAAVLVEEPDMATYGAESFDSTGVRSSIVPALLPEGESGRAYLDRLFQIDRLPPITVWNYAYRRAFLSENGFSFRPELTVAEDFDFNFTCLSQAASVRGTGAVLYRYRLRADSLSHHLSLKKERQKAEIDVKWLRQYPTAAMANSWCYRAFGLCRLGSRRDLRELLALYEASRGYLRLVTGGKYRFAGVLFRLLGFYRGSQVLMFLIDLRHRLLGIWDETSCAY